MVRQALSDSVCTGGNVLLLRFVLVCTPLYFERVGEGDCACLAKLVMIYSYMYSLSCIAIAMQ